jgi:hypothetical protein
VYPFGARLAYAAIRRSRRSRPAAVEATCAVQQLDIALLPSRALHGDRFIAKVDGKRRPPSWWR